MRADRLAALVAAFTTAITLAPSAAHAFCRTRTVPVPRDFDPVVNSTGCFEQGLPLYHASACVPYRLLAKESPRIPNTVLSGSLARAFDTWTSRNAFCSPGLTAIELASTPSTTIVGYTMGERANNVIGVVDGPWPHGDGGNTLSLATITFNSDTGEVYDADVEVRADVAWSFGATPPSDGFDFDAVITHETGHFLGLAHSQLPTAVMWASYTPGTTTQRVLTDDDARGICAIYPDRKTRSTGTGLVPATVCNLAAGVPGTPPNGCGDPAIGNGCAAAASSSQTPRPSWLAALGVAGALTLGLRARARRRARTSS